MRFNHQGVRAGFTTLLIGLVFISGCSGKKDERAPSGVVASPPATESQPPVPEVPSETLPPPPPLAPAAPILKGLPGNTSAKIEWTTSTRATHYKLMRSEGTGAFADLATSLTVTNYQDTGLTNGNTYKYVVIAVNEGGNSNNSNVISIVPKAPPIAPTGLAASASDQLVSLSWSPTVGADAYNVLMGESLESLTVLSSGVTETNSKISSLKNGTTYYFAIIAFNQVGSSEKSDVVSAMPILPPPSAPATPRVVSRNGKAWIEWDKVDLAATYSVMRRTGSNPFVTIAADLTVTRYFDIGLVNGVAVDYAVRAHNASGSSVRSGFKRVTPVTISARITAGDHDTCATLPDKTVSCWGQNQYQQLGPYIFSADVILKKPRPVQGISGAIDFKTDYSQSCALLSDGTVKCLGNNVAEPKIVDGITNAVSLAKGSNHQCVILSDRTIKCWGRNYYGQLGNGTRSDYPVNTPVLVSGINNAISVAASYEHTCAVLADKTVKCWGLNDRGALGIGGFGGSRFAPESVIGISNAEEVVTGFQSSCARLSDGTVKCWGYNYYGQVGIGNYSDQHTPTLVKNLSNVEKISLGWMHACAISTDETLRCWGDANNGQTGIYSNYGITTPQIVPSAESVIAISTGHTHTCFVVVDGSMKCMGTNWRYELGNGSSSYDGISTPVTVKDLGSAVFIADPLVP